jgi:hypothetical protein
MTNSKQAGYRALADRNKPKPGRPKPPRNGIAPGKKPPVKPVMPRSRG